MAHGRVSKEAILEAALELFRTSGFNGVSLSDISHATGLEKSSLYFRFPGGKEEIVLAALTRAGEFFIQNVFTPLTGEGGSTKRVQIAADALRDFYADGSKPCVTDVLSLPLESSKISEMLAQIMRAWLAAFSEIARESGCSSEEAQLRAEEAIIAIEGSLVFSRVSKDTTPFQRVLAALPDLLTGEHARERSGSELSTTSGEVDHNSRESFSV
jgi:TetR/AcrR family transcriptional repressor of lmrAB and yxaGH operons